jgi:hypothetical protein
VSETNKEAHQGFLVNILAAQHRWKQTRELARLLANIRTTLLQSENWFQAGVGNKQGNSSFRKAIRLPAISRGGSGRNRRIKRKQPFLATFRQPTFFYYNIIFSVLYAFIPNSSILPVP